MILRRCSTSIGLQMGGKSNIEWISTAAQKPPTGHDGWWIFPSMTGMSRMLGAPTN
ncbi:hypothetical protein [Trinickia fusca]|uniref:hypothetical protein n=1 Tax=Trinickia fusca TaxID=2419777 RepID=UPI0015FEC5B2|nr:hypothetical protein [Trinickia fusca]